MTSSVNPQNRIRIACTDLERALHEFEDDTEAKKRSKEEAEKLESIKKQLDEIKKQLATLSD
jgi:hypothetical protein